MVGKSDQRGKEMETWQIRERGTNELKTQSSTLKNLIIPDYSDKEHYICRKGEILVNEQEYNALKAELAELKEKRSKGGAVNSNFVGSCVEGVEVFKPSRPEKEVEPTRGDEIAELVARIAYFEYQHLKLFDAGVRMSPEMKKISEQQLSARNQLATIINQGV